MLIFQKIVILKKVLNAIKCEVKILLLISLVCVTEQHYVSIFFTRLWAVVTAEFVWVKIKFALVKMKFAWVKIKFVWVKIKIAWVKIFLFLNDIFEIVNI